MHRYGHQNSAAGANGGSHSKSIADRLLCNGCGILKPHSAYSKNRIDTLRRYGMGPKGSLGMKQLYCTGCSALQTTELFCKMCRTAKGLDKFSKTQRSSPDDATCLICMAHRLETEPDHMNHESGMHNRETIDEDDDTRSRTTTTRDNDDGGVPLRGTKEQMDDSSYAIAQSNAGSATKTSLGWQSRGGSGPSKSGYMSSTSGMASSAHKPAPGGNWPKIKAAPVVKRPENEPRPNDSDGEVEVADSDDEDPNWDM